MRFCSACCDHVLSSSLHNLPGTRDVSLSQRAQTGSGVDCVWNVMAHAQKLDFVFRLNERVHLNRWERQFSRLLAAGVCASAVVMVATPCSEVPTPFAGFPFNSPPVRHRVPSHFNWTLPPHQPPVFNLENDIGLHFQRTREKDKGIDTERVWKCSYAVKCKLTRASRLFNL